MNTSAEQGFGVDFQADDSEISAEQVEELRGAVDEARQYAVQKTKDYDALRTEFIRDEQYLEPGARQELIARKEVASDAMDAAQKKLDELNDWLNKRLNKK